MKLTKRHLIAYGALLLTLATTVGITYSAFTDKVKLTGATLSTGSADIKLLADNTLGTVTSNLVDSIPGPTFTNISAGWDGYFPIKIYNNGTSTIALTSNSDYTTASDPDDLRSVLRVTINKWEDRNNDGIYTGDEQGQSLGDKTIIKWKSEGFDMGAIQKGETKGYIIYFYANAALTDSKQGKTGVFDIELNSMGI